MLSFGADRQGLRPTPTSCVVRVSTTLQQRDQGGPRRPGGLPHIQKHSFTANPAAENCQGRWIKPSAEANGAFTVINSRNGFSKKHAPRN